MGALRVHFLGIFVAVFCMLVTGFSEGNRRIVNEDSSRNNGPLNFEELDEDTAEQVWIHCRKDLEEITKLNSNDNTKFSRKTFVHNDLPPQLKRSLLLSLKSKSISSRASCRDECQEFVYKLYIHPSPHGSLGSTRKRASRVHDPGKKVILKVERSSSKHQNKKKPPDHVILIGIIISTAVATLSLFLLLLFCCLGRNESKVESECAENDENLCVGVCPARASGVCLTSDSVEGKTNLNNTSKEKVLSGNAYQTTEVGHLPLPPGRTAPSSNTQPPPPAPPPAPPAPKAPPPPPPGGRRPPNPPKPGSNNKPPAPQGLSTIGNENDQNGGSNSQKTKLKPLFWDKMNASPGQSMVWNEIKGGSFQLNEEMMETLFGHASAQSKGDKGKSTSNMNSQPKLIQIIDPKKAQNLSITLKALHVTTQKVCNALLEGTHLPVELISALIKMPPTQEEELKLRLYNGDLALLAPADRFLKIIGEIPFVYKRLEALLFMSTFHEESSPLKNAFETLEVACTKLKNSRLFLKLLEAVLKTGNRMNVGTYRGGAQAIKLDSLLKLSDVKGTDCKTTLLTFVVQEIIRSEGFKVARNKHSIGGPSTNNTKQLQEEQVSLEYYRRLGLEVVSQLNTELHDVKKAAIIDGDHITSTVLKLANMLKKTEDLIDDALSTTEEAKEFCAAFKGFMKHAEADITWMLEEEKRIMALVKSTGDFFHGNSAKDEGLRLFVIVRDFLKLLDKVCNDIKKEMNSKKKDVPAGKKEAAARQQTWSNIRDKLFPTLKEGKVDYSSSDDEDMSP
ncbi:formin-like protein 3 [Rutidosis leptorrhynchoides]|uniref:formin-like protein 3 n=1 Tax=Rutidosis leptorrhynchoides TaxID=125765 RepID=UPI003A9A4063